MRRLLTPIGCLVAAALAAGGAFFVYSTREVRGPDVQVVATPTRDATPVPAVAFADVTAAAGIRFTHHSGAAGQKLLPETMGGGVAVLDYDRDGRPDLLFVSGCPWPGAGTPAERKAPCLTLYRNAGDGTFYDATRDAGLEVVMYGMGVCVGDFDNDGYDDFFVSSVGGNKLFHNIATGAGRGFADATSIAGVGESGWPGTLSADEFTRHATPIPFGSSATFLDYDRDGKLDLFVCHYVTWSPAVDLSINSSLTGSGRSYQQPQQLSGSQCRLYHNLGGGKFADVSTEAGITVTRAQRHGAGRGGAAGGEGARGRRVRPRRRRLPRHLGRQRHRAKLLLPKCRRSERRTQVPRGGRGGQRGLRRRPAARRDGRRFRRVQAGGARRGHRQLRQRTRDVSSRRSTAAGDCCSPTRRSRSASKARRRAARSSSARCFGTTIWTAGSTCYCVTATWSRTSRNCKPGRSTSSRRRYFGTPAATAGCNSSRCRRGSAARSASPSSAAAARHSTTTATAT